MIEYRVARTDEWEACIEHVNYVFSMAHCPHDFEKMIPKVYGKDDSPARLHRIAVNERGRIEAMIGMLPETVYVCQKKLNAAFIGSVSVHPKARGKGHMKILMEQWMEQLDGHFDLAVLGGQRQRYGYFGFTPAGVKYVYEINSANVRHALVKEHSAGIDFCPLFSVDGAAVFAKEKNESRIAFVERREDQIADILGTYGEEALAVLENGELTGYLILSGSDAVTEFVIDVKRLPGVLKALMEKRGLPEISVRVPVYETAYNACLAQIAEGWRMEGCEMVRVFDFAAVLEAYLTLKAKTTGIADGIFSAVLAGEPITVTVKNSEVLVEKKAASDAPKLDREQAQMLLFSMQGCFGCVPGSEEYLQNGKIPCGWFPLPLYWHMADEF